MPSPPMTFPSSSKWSSDRRHVAAVLGHVPSKTIKETHQPLAPKECALPSKGFGDDGAFTTRSSVSTFAGSSLDGFSARTAGSGDCSSRSRQDIVSEAADVPRAQDSARTGELEAVLPGFDVQTLVDKQRSVDEESHLPTFFGHAPLIVKNTFLDTPAERSDSLDEFRMERQVASCPATRDHTMDTPRSLLQDRCAEQPFADSNAQLHSPWQSPGQSPRDFSRNGDAGQDVGLSTDAFSGGFSAPSQDSMLVANDQMLLSSASVHGWACAWQFPVFDEAPSAGFESPNVSHWRSSMKASTATHASPSAEDPGVVMKLNLSSIFESELGAADMEGSDLQNGGPAPHASGECKPCVFFHKDGCRQGDECSFCHLCRPEERKKRRWQKLHEQQRLRKQEARRLAAALADEAQEAALAAESLATDTNIARKTMHEQAESVIDAKVSRV